MSWVFLWILILCDIDEDFNDVIKLNYKNKMTSTWRTTSNKRWIFNFYFYYKDESREKAEVKRHEVIMYLRGLLERKSLFAVVARDENKEQACLLLRGYMRLKSPCNNLHAKAMVGRYSKVRPTTFGDVFYLMKYFHVDRRCDVIEELPGTKGTVVGTKDVKCVLKTLAEQIDSNSDFNVIS
jgi:hypothetical protein